MVLNKKMKKKQSWLLQQLETKAGGKQQRTVRKAVY